MDYTTFRKSFVIMTDPNVKFGRWALLTPMGYTDVVAECFLPTREKLYLRLKTEEDLSSYLTRL